MRLERFRIGEPLVHLPDQGILGLDDVERDATGLAPSQRNVLAKMFDDDRRFILVAADEVSAEMDTPHDPILACHTRPRPLDCGVPRGGLLLFLNPMGVVVGVASLDRMAADRWLRRTLARLTDRDRKVLEHELLDVMLTKSS